MRNQPHALMKSCRRRLVICVVFLLQLNATTTAGASEAEKVDKWIADLRSPNANVRLSAAYNYNQLQPINEITIRQIIAGLKESNSYVRRYCASALGDLDKEHNLIIPALLEALRDPDQNVREHSVLALVKIGPDAVPPLIETLKNTDVGFDDSGLVKPPPLTAVVDMDEEESEQDNEESKRVVALRDYAALALIEIGIPAVPALIEASVAKENQSSVYAEYILSAITENDRDSRSSFLKDPDQRLRLWANAGEEQVPELLRMLQQGKGRFRIVIIRALGGIYDAAQPSIPTLLKLLNDPDPDVRLEVVKALAEFGPEAGSTAPVLARLLPDQSKEMKHQILFALWQMDIQTEPILRALSKALTDPDVQIRTDALNILLSFDAGRRVTPIAVRMLAQRAAADVDSERASLDHISEMGSIAILPLIQLLKNPDEKIRLFALKGLDGMESRDIRITRAVKPLLLDSSKKVRLEAAMLLASWIKFGPALAVLKSLFNDPDARTTREVVAAFETLSDREEIPGRIFVQALQAKPEVRESALAALDYVAKCPSEVIDSLVNLLSDKDELVRAHAARLLREHYDEATEATSDRMAPKLLTALKQQPATRVNAGSYYCDLIDALGTIGEEEALFESLNSDNPELVGCALRRLIDDIPQDSRLMSNIAGF